MKTKRRKKSTSLSALQFNNRLYKAYNDKVAKMQAELKRKLK